MGRYANYGFEIIYDENNNIKGINFGYGDVSEHNKKFKGDEVIYSKLDRMCFKLQKGPVVDRIFRDEKIKSASDIRLLKGSDGSYLLSNFLTIDEIEQDVKYGVVFNYSDVSIEEIDEMISSVRNHPDKKLCNPEFDTSWNEYTFFIVANTPFSNALLKNLYENIQNGNVALDTSFPYFFSDRGLSFLNLNFVTIDDIEHIEALNNSKTKKRLKK